MTALFLLLELLLLLGSSKLAVGADSLCSGRPGSQFCRVGGALDVSCSPDTASLVLKFQSVASWPASPASPGRGLVGCDSVDHLKVTGWQGPELESGHTAQLPNLSSMEILDGNLTTVGPDVCGKRLRQLSLARNRVRDLSQRALIGCGSLESLDLSDNRIERLPDGLLAACGSLRTLKLSGNRLSQLGPRALQGAVSLFELHALGNQFRTLGSLERAFASNQRLSLIDLRNNELFAYLPASDDGLCGPENVTVRLHFAGCPPAPATDAAVCETVRRHRCLGSSAHLLVTFTSCQVPIATKCSSSFPKSDLQRWSLNNSRNQLRLTQQQPHRLPQPVPALHGNSRIRLSIFHSPQRSGRRSQVGSSRVAADCPGRHCALRSASTTRLSCRLSSVEASLGSPASARRAAGQRVLQPPVLLSQPSIVHAV
ncbi:hypothetical protein BOX15_Mlig009071g1 [Macrostomum lignano]|uniref:LRRNT domain-containing protein n=1 Tax=Macrostomum lignano TaxID=282301 RepID=A0A267GZQ7_9PLAT|nr:hypothetical protein BOX15_Mlig009071g1 [Macrostomum lignano]